MAIEWSNSELSREDGLVTRVADAAGCTWVRAKGSNGSLVEAEFLLPGGGSAVLRSQVGQDPVLGSVDGIFLPDSNNPIALIQATHWRAPKAIPAVDKPGALPPGLGAAVLNYLSLNASLNGEHPLRYLGPYPTGKLFDSLHRSFELQHQDRAQAWQLFHAGVEEAALENRFVSPNVDFYPRPFAWLAHGQGVCAELRGGLERIFLNGQAYPLGHTLGRHLVPSEDGFDAVVGWAGEVWAKRLHVNALGEPEGAPAPLPESESPLRGRTLEQPMREAMAAALVPRAPKLLAEALRVVLLKAPIAWGQAAEDPCRFDGRAIIINEAMGTSLAGKSPEVVLQTLAYALEPVASALATQVLTRAAGRSEPQE